MNNVSIPMKAPSLMILQKGNMRFARSKWYNYDFNVDTGEFARWGSTLAEDPTYAPFPEILDIEVTTKCNGPAGKLCGFCSPAGTLVNTPRGDVAIETLVAGDVVWSATSLHTKKPRVRENTIIETYQREYNGELIIIELENGKILELTPEHPVMVKGGIEIFAGDLTKDHEIIHLSDFEQCNNCGNPVTSTNRTKRFYCSSECQTKNKHNQCLVCGENFIGKTKRSKFCNCIDFGDYKHPLNNVFVSMIYRCYDKSRNVYKHYGEKGIKPSKEWQSFCNFLSDMESSYVEGYELERLDSSEGYNKENCIWLSKHEQRQHRSQPVKSSCPYKCVTAHGKKYKLCLPTQSHDGSNEYIGLFNTQKECVDLYNNHMKEMYPERYVSYIQDYVGEL